MNSFEKLIAESERLLKSLQEADRIAKGKGELLGRYIVEGIADGRAYYQIVRVTARTVKLKHVPYLDGYKIPMVEALGHSVPLKYARQNIEIRDRLDSLFAKKDA